MCVATVHVAVSVCVAVLMYMAVCMHMVRCVSLCLRVCVCVCGHVAVSSACVCVCWMEEGNRRLRIILGTRGARVEEELSRRKWKLRVEALGQGVVGDKD